MVCSCPKIDYKPMAPREAGRTLFGCDSKGCYPYKIEINPTSQIYATIDYFNKMSVYLNAGKIDSFIKKYGSLGGYIKKFEDYVLTHENTHYKFLKENPKAIHKLMKKYGNGWRPILEGINDKQAIEQGYKKDYKTGDLWKEFSPYEREKRLVEKLAKQDKEIEKYLMKDYPVGSCIPS